MPDREEYSGNIRSTRTLVGGATKKASKGINDQVYKELVEFKKDYLYLAERIITMMYLLKID